MGTLESQQRCGYERRWLQRTHVPSHIGRPKGGRIDPVVPDGTGHGPQGGIARSVINRTESCSPIGYTNDASQFLD